MVQSRGRAGLALEPLAALRVAGQIPGQDLERDRAVEPGVEGAVDLPHSARPEGAQHLVVSESGSGRERHGPSCAEPCSPGPGFRLGECHELRGPARF